MLVNTAVTEEETREQISKVNGQSFPKDVSAMKKVEDGMTELPQRHGSFR